MNALSLYPTIEAQGVETAEPRCLDRRCSLCPLAGGAHTRCIPADGQPGGLLIVGEAPGRQEDAVGRPFIGPSGDVIRRAAAKFWNGPVVYDNALRCFPGKKVPGVKSIAACQGYLKQTIIEAKPKRIITLGAVAALSVLGRKEIGRASCRERV